MTTGVIASIIIIGCIFIGVVVGIIVSRKQKSDVEKSAPDSFPFSPPISDHDCTFEINFATFRTPCRHRLPKYDAEHMTSLISQCLKTNKSCIKEFCPFLNKTGE